MLDEFDEGIVQADRLRDSGALAEALEHYGRLGRRWPGRAIVPYKLGTVLARMGQPAEAEQNYRDALAINEYYPEANNNLAVLLVARGEWDEGEICYRRALAENPDYFEAHIGLAKLLRLAWRSREGLYFSRRACKIDPSSGVAHELVGHALKKLERINEAMSAIRRATELQPELALPWQTLANCLQGLGRHQEADWAYAKAVEVGGDDPLPRSNYAYAANFLDISREQAWQRHQAFGAWARKTVGPVATPPSVTRPLADRRIRVGFVSGDLRRHSVAYFVRGALEQLSRSKFQLFAYFDAHREDEVSAWLKPLFHHWRDIFSVPHEKVLDMVRQDRIDILFDLSAHTGSNRMLLFARRAAPVQVSYIGYANTTGLDTMDYRLADIWTDPEGDGDDFHSEELWRLSRCFLCYVPPEKTPDLNHVWRRNADLVTFGSFNNRAKISDRCLDAWVRLLQKVPNSRLLIKSLMGTEDADSREGFLHRFVDRGISAERLDIRRFDEQLDGHLQRYSDVDIALDTFPYNGTTTTCEALWMGVPVVSLAGDRHAGRVGVSLLESIGLGELVGKDVEDYIRIAAELASDRERLKSMHAGMRERLHCSPLFDRQSMAEAFGEALRGMWRRHCESFPVGLPIENDNVQADQPIRLNIGGRQAMEGWKILDIEPREEVDYVGDVRDLSAFGEESCSEIYASQVLEHLPPFDILPVLNELRRMLTVGGRLYISVPDLDTLTWLFVKPGHSKPEKFEIMQIMFGDQTTERTINRIGLNFDFLVDMLRDVGFSSVEHVESFGLFDDASLMYVVGHPISLNLIVTK